MMDVSCYVLSFIMHNPSPRNVYHKDSIKRSWKGGVRRWRQATEDSKMRHVILWAYLCSKSKCDEDREGFEKPNRKALTVLRMRIKNNEKRKEKSWNYFSFGHKIWITDTIHELSNFCHLFYLMLVWYGS